MPPRQQHRRHRDRGQSDRCVTSLTPNEQASNVSGPLRFDGASAKHGAREARRDHRPDITLEVAHTAKHAREGNHTTDSRTDHQLERTRQTSWQFRVADVDVFALLGWAGRRRMNQRLQCRLAGSQGVLWKLGVCILCSTMRETGSTSDQRRG